MAKQRRTGPLIALGLGAALAWAAKDIPRQMGARAKGTRQRRMESSRPEFGLCSRTASLPHSGQVVGNR